MTSGSWGGSRPPVPTAKACSAPSAVFPLPRGEARSEWPPRRPREVTGLVTQPEGAGAAGSPGLGGANSRPPVPLLICPQEPRVLPRPPRTHPGSWFPPSPRVTSVSLDCGPGLQVPVPSHPVLTKSGRTLARTRFTKLSTRLGRSLGTRCRVKARRRLRGSQDCLPWGASGE